MAQFTEAELSDIHAYEAIVLGIINDAVEHLQRGAPPLAHVAGGCGKSELWCRQLIAEYRSWRGFLDAIPAVAPPSFAGAHARVLRWAASVATGGDAIAAAIEAGDRDQLLAAAQTLLQHERSYETMIIALDRAIEASCQ